MNIWYLNSDLAWRPWSQPKLLSQRRRAGCAYFESKQNYIAESYRNSNKLNYQMILPNWGSLTNIEMRLLF